MELPIKIIVTIIVILVAAFVVLAYFSGGIGNVSKLVQSMIDSISGGGNRPGVIETCAAVKGVCKEASVCNTEEGSVNYLNTCPGEPGKNIVCCMPKRTS